MRGLGLLTIIAAGVLGVTVLTAGDATLMSSRLPGKAAIATIDPISFASGLLAGIVATKLLGIEWGDVPRRILDALLSWRRTFKLATLAVLCAGVLLFY